MSVFNADNLLACYAAGCFPMADDRHDPFIYLVEPEQRGIIPLDRFHIPRRLKRTIRQGIFELTVDKALREVIAGCAAPAPDRPTTWLNDELIELYGELFDRGHVHSVEAWCEGELVGGLYGVKLGAAFFGESMFSRRTDASKVALVELVARLKAGRFHLLDTQFVTDHLAQFGTMKIPRSAYQRMLKHALMLQADFPKGGQGLAGELVGGVGAAAGGRASGMAGSSGFRHSSTQTS